MIPGVLTCSWHQHYKDRCDSCSPGCWQEAAVLCHMGLSLALLRYPITSACLSPGQMRKTEIMTWPWRLFSTTSFFLLVTRSNHESPREGTRQG